MRGNLAGRALHDRQCGSEKPSALNEAIILAKERKRACTSQSIPESRQGQDDKVVRDYLKAKNNKIWKLP